MSSRNDVAFRMNLSKRRPRRLDEVFDEKTSYQYLVEEIIQEVQFTYAPLVEKKTKGMLTEIGSTG